MKYKMTPSECNQNLESRQYAEKVKETRGYKKICKKILENNPEETGKILFVETMQRGKESLREMDIRAKKADDAAAYLHENFDEMARIATCADAGGIVLGGMYMHLGDDGEKTAVVYRAKKELRRGIPQTPYMIMRAQNGLSHAKEIEFIDGAHDAEIWHSDCDRKYGATMITKIRAFRAVGNRLEIFCENESRIIENDEQK